MSYGANGSEVMGIKKVRTITFKSEAHKNSTHSYPIKGAHKTERRIKQMMKGKNVMMDYLIDVITA